MQVVLMIAFALHLVHQHLIWIEVAKLTMMCSITDTSLKLVDTANWHLSQDLMSQQHSNSLEIYLHTFSSCCAIACCLCNFSLSNSRQDSAYRVLERCTNYQSAESK